MATPNLFGGKMKRIYTLFVSFAVCAVLCAGLLAATRAQEDLKPKDGKANKDKFQRKGKDAIPGKYIVVLEDAAVGERGEMSIAGETADLLAKIHGGAVKRVFKNALNGYAADMTEWEAIQLSQDPRVKFVEEDARVYANATQSGATFGLDRVDQRALPLNGTYTYNYTGSGVRVYVIDTGILTSHTQFGTRASAVFDAFGGSGQDCNGHGTHVAGTAGGSTYGVAKSALLRAVRVLDCAGSGSNSGVIAGVDWVAANHIKPAVANMSLGGGASTALDNAVTNAVNAGVTFVVAAGNENQDACNVSPARATSAIAVGSTTSTDARSSFSNFGTCVDIFAPGSSITSAWYTSTSATNTISGTSMASPHVAGAAALYLQRSTGASPSTVRSVIINNSTTGKLFSIGSGSPNRLLYTLF